MYQEQHTKVCFPDKIVMLKTEVARSFYIYSLTAHQSTSQAVDCRPIQQETRGSRAVEDYGNSLYIHKLLSFLPVIKLLALCFTSRVKTSFFNQTHMLLTNLLNKFWYRKKIHETLNIERILKRPGLTTATTSA
jgi:hypothetical protein